MGATSQGIDVPESNMREYNSSVKDYIALTKPRVMTLVIFSGIAGMYMAPGQIHPLFAFITILSLVMGAGSAAAINMWYDRDIDAIMTRTKQRPIVTGKILPDEALAFGVVTGFFSVFLMLVCVNSTASMLLLTTILFYIFIYTMWLKRSSVQNIVIGGASGALPPMIGWAAVTGDVSIESFSLFLLIFLWTPPHFWSLALYKSRDYRACNIPMMPVIKGDAYTKKYILFYTLLTVCSTYIPYFLGMTSWVGLTIISPLNIIFVYYSWQLLSDYSNSMAPRMFGYSIIYLFAIFGVLMISVA